jgi:hypothetical protein
MYDDDDYEHGEVLKPTVALQYNLRIVYCLFASFRNSPYSMPPQSLFAEADF